MARKLLLLALLLAGCSKGAEADLQYIGEARSAAAEWALINEQANEGKLNATYVASMHEWLREDIHASLKGLSQPDAPYAREMAALLQQRRHFAGVRRIGLRQALQRSVDILAQPLVHARNVSGVELALVRLLVDQRPLGGGRACLADVLQVRFRALRAAGEQQGQQQQLTRHGRENRCAGGPFPVAVRRRCGGPCPTASVR